MWFFHTEQYTQCQSLDNHRKVNAALFSGFNCSPDATWMHLCSGHFKNKFPSHFYPSHEILIFPESIFDASPFRFCVRAPYRQARPTTTTWSRSKLQIPFFPSYASKIFSMLTKTAHSLINATLLFSLKLTIAAVSFPLVEFSA